MSLGLQLEITIETLIAALLTAIIGMERERRKDHSAGLRTHMLVGVGACLFTALSVHGFSGGDPSRVAAQVVVALSFLGAGVIVRSQLNVHNLTTAADIWVTAAIGMTVGLGGYFLAVCVSLLAWVILVLVRKVEDKPES